MANNSNPNPDRLRVGVYIIPPVQFLDVSPVDILGSLSRDYMDDTPLPAHVRAQGKEVIIKYISPTGPSSPSAGPVIADITSSAGLRIDHAITDPEVQPGAFDLLIVPGPPPAKVFTDAELDFVRRHWDGGKGSATIMGVCTGSHILAAAGILEGRTATMPRFELPEFRKKHPGTTWLDKRWVRDPSGKLWTSGGVTNGQDMVAAYCREKYPGAFSEVVLAMMDVGDRGQDYAGGQVTTTAWWVFTFIKAWFKRKPAVEKTAASK